MADDIKQNKFVLDRARAAVLARDYALAIRLYRGLLSAEPDNVELLCGLGDIYERSGQDAAAIPLYQEVTRIQPDNVNVLNRLAGVYRRLQRYDDSIATLEQALITDENNVQVYYNLGFTYKLMGKFDDAIQCFGKVIEENPGDVLAYNHLGSIYDAQKLHDKAIQTYQRGLKADPNHPVLHLNLARSYQAKGQDDLAEKEYEAALRTKPGWLDAIDGYASLLLTRNDARSAGAIVQQAIRLNPTDVKMHTKMGDVYSERLLYDQARGEYREALKYDSEYADAIVGLASAYEAEGRTSDALKIARQLESVAQDDYESMRRYSRFLLSSDKLDAASRKIKQLWDRDPDDVRTLNLLAQYYICRKEEAKALGCFRKIRAVDPDYTAYLRDAADRYEQIGHLKRAEEYYLKYLETNERDATSMMRLAQNYEKQGDNDKALSYYRMLHEADDTNPVLAASIRRLDPNALIAGHEQLDEPRKDVDDGVAPQDEAIAAQDDGTPEDDFAPGDDFAPQDDFAPGGIDDDIAPAGGDDSGLDSLGMEDFVAPDDLEPEAEPGLDSLGQEPDDDVGDFLRENQFGAGDGTMPLGEDAMDTDGLFEEETLSQDEPEPVPLPPVTDAVPQDAAAGYAGEPAGTPATEEPVGTPAAQEPAAPQSTVMLNDEEGIRIVGQQPTVIVITQDALQKGLPVTEPAAQEPQEEPAEEDAVVDDLSDADNAELLKEEFEESELFDDAFIESNEELYSTEEPAPVSLVKEQVLDAPPAPQVPCVLIEESVLEAPAPVVLVEEQVLDAPPEPQVAAVLIEETVLEPPEPQPCVQPEAEPVLSPQIADALVEEQVLDAPPPLGDAELYAASRADDGFYLWREENHHLTAELFEKLKSLIAFLPADKQSEFNASHERASMDFIILRFSGIRGLLSLSSRLREGWGIQGTKVTDEGKALVRRVVESMEAYVESLPDKTLVRPLEAELAELRKKL